MNFEQIMKSIAAKEYHPVYFLCGEEEYFIDCISDALEKSVLDEEEKEFNQSVLYGLETDAVSIAAEAKRYPMMAPYNVVIVKEAQGVKNWDALSEYFKNPSPTTILVIAHKYKKPDGRSNAIKAVKKSALYFESKKLYDNEVIPWVEKRFHSLGLKIDPKASMLLLESIGTDLSKLNNEIDKLAITCAKGSLIDAAVIEKNIGISKDYNVFELNKALGNRDVLKANKIIQYFGKNEKDYPIPAVLPMVYLFFAKVLLMHAVKHLDRGAQAKKLGVSPFYLKDYEIGIRNYTVKKIARIMSYLRKTDLASKGYGNTSASQEDLLKELVFFILH